MNTQQARRREIRAWAKALPQRPGTFFESNPVRSKKGDKTQLYLDVLHLFQPEAEGTGYISSLDYETRLLVLAFAEALDAAGDLPLAEPQPTFRGC